MFTSLHLPLTNRDEVMRWRTDAVRHTSRYLFGPMANAIPRIQREYWDILIKNGIVPE